jgi:3D (Asp-Asp-Asp) domain-containing protein/peptidoglycan hydrolase CwlO-like protein
VVTVVVAASLLVPIALAADPTASLRAKGRALEAQEQAALLELYALNSRLDRARAELEDAGARVEVIERERALAGNRLRIARRTSAIAQRRLGDQLLALYKQERPDPLAIILGSRSLEDVVTALDNLTRAASATSVIITEAGQARARVARLLRELARRRGTLLRLRAAAEARAAALANAQSARLSYIGDLRTERHLNDEQIVALEARARAAQARSAVETVKAETEGSVASFTAQTQLAASPPPAPAPAPPTDPEPPAAPAPAAPEPAAPPPALPLSGRSLTVIATAYSLPGYTASGLPVGAGVVAVDPTVIPMGTRMTIPGYGEGIAADVGSAIKGNRIDVWFPTLEEARAWGVKTVTITVH